MEKLYCLIAFLVGLGCAIQATRLIAATRTPDDGLFDGWRDILQAWREAQDLKESTLIVFLILFALALMIVRFIFRVGKWGALAAFYTALGVGWCAVCNVPWLDLEKVRGILRDVIHFFRGDPLEAATR